jgi:hypothetical protein
MTVIVATKTAMYCDSRCTSGETHFATEKVFRIRGSLVGTAGDSNAIERFLFWFKGSRTKAIEKGDGTFTVLVLNKKGLFLFEDCSMPDPIKDPWYAIGSGGSVAIGALAMGAAAGRAVEIACEHADGCGLPVQEFTL